MIPEGGRWLLDINPMSHFLGSYRNVFIYDRSPDYITLLYIGSISAIVLVFMIFFYSKHEHRIIRAL